MNKVMLVGRLTRDPVLNSSTATPSCYFTIAIDRPFLNAEGKRDADFVPVIAWGKQAETIVNYMKKGRQIAVEGRIQTRNYDKEGKTVYVTEVVATNFEFIGSNGGTGMSDPNNIESLNQTAPPTSNYNSEPSPYDFGSNNNDTTPSPQTMNIGDDKDLFGAYGDAIASENIDEVLPF